MAGRELSVAISFCPLSTADPECKLVRVVDLNTGELLSTEEVLADMEMMVVIREVAEKLVIQEAAKLHVREVR